MSKSARLLLVELALVLGAFTAISFSFSFSHSEPVAVSSLDVLFLRNIGTHDEKVTICC